MTAVDGYAQLPAAERESVLVAVGRSAAGAKRDVDSAAHLDGDELAIIATYTDERGAGVLAERVCAEVREQGGVTVSAGVVSYPRHGATTEQLLRAAYLAAARSDAKIVNHLARRLVESQGKPPSFPVPSAGAK